MSPIPDQDSTSVSRCNCLYLEPICSSGPRSAVPFICLLWSRSKYIQSTMCIHPLWLTYANLKIINRGLWLFVKNWICSFILRIEPHQKVSVKTNIKIFVCETYHIDACTCKGIQKNYLSPIIYILPFLHTYTILAVHFVKFHSVMFWSPFCGTYLAC